MIITSIHRATSVKLGKTDRFEDANGLLEFVCRTIMITDEDGNTTEVRIFSKNECILEIEE